MKNIFIMKKRNIVISVLIALLCIIGATSSFARVFTAGERIFVNAQTDFNWAQDGAKLFLYCFGGSSSVQWFELEQVCGNYYMASMSAGTWNTCIVVRKNSSGTAGNWDNKWNQTGDITIDGSKNYIKYFSNESSSATWDNFPFYYHDGSEELYFSKAPNDWSWFGNDFGSKNYVYAKFFRTSEPYCETWSKASNDRPGLFKVDIPAGIWSHVIFARLGNDSPSDGNIISDPSKDANQSRNLPVFANEIYLNFKQRSTSGGEDYNLLKDLGAKPSADPTTSDNIWGTPRRDIKICAQALERGDNYTLTPLLNDAKNAYDYSEGISVWWKWNTTSGKWEYAANKWNDVNQTLENVDDAYYYLWTTMGEKEKYRRFLHLVKDSDCKINCEITSLNYAITPVNVIDSTFGIEGLVAFTKQEGDLVVSYGKNTYRLPTDSMQTFTSPESPQTFSLSGLKADGSTDNHLLVEFTGVGGAKADSLITAPKLETDGVVEHSSKDEANHYSPSKETYAHDETITLTPHVETLEADSFAWLDAKGNILKAGNKDIKSTPYDVSNTWGFDTTLVYYYTEYNIPPESNDNLMGNGYYENTSKEDDDNKDASPYKTISGYKYTGVWGDITGKRDAYYNEYGNETGLFGVTTSADIFWNRFAKISPRKGEYFGVFDGDADGEEKVAWSAETNSTTNKDLKLQKGTTYLFSFWVANVNNAGEMISYGTDGTPVTNNAILQFKISYKYKDENGDEQEETLPLGKETDLNNYLDNFWHQNSATFTSPVDADDVTISVVDKNKSGLSIGNDFALDDIRFRSVSVQSATVRARERFAVKFVEPTPEVRNVSLVPLTAPACDRDTFTFKVSFEYLTNTSHDVKLELNVTGLAGEVKKEVDDLGDTGGAWVKKEFVFSSNTSANPAVTTDTDIKAKATDEQMKAEVIVSTTDAISVYRADTAYSADVDIPVIPSRSFGSPLLFEDQSCADSTYTLLVPITYTNQHGDMYVQVNDKEEYKVHVTNSAGCRIEDSYVGYLADQRTPRTTLAIIPGIKREDVDAVDHKVSVWFTEGCDVWSTTYAAPNVPMMVVHDVVPAPVSCNNLTYTLNGKLSYRYLDGKAYCKIGVGGNPNEITGMLADKATKDTREFSIPSIPADSLMDTLIVWYEGRGTACPDTIIYRAPFSPQINSVTIDKPSSLSCGASDKYSATITVNASNHREALILVSLNDGEPKKKNSSSTGSTSFTFTDLLADGGNNVVKAWFDVARKQDDDCYKKNSFSSPTRPVANIKDQGANTFTYSDPVCDQETVTLKFDIEYINQDGDLYIWVDGLSPKKYDYTDHKSSTPHSVHIEYPGVQADGLSTHKLNYEFRETGYCKETNIALPASSRWPVIKSVSVTPPANVPCSKNDYEATINVSYVNVASTDRLVVQYNGTETKTIERTLSGTSTSFTFTLDDIDAGSGRELYVYFEGAAADCKTTAQHKGTYTAPYRPELVINSVDTLHDACDATTYAIAIDWKYRAFAASDMSYKIDDGTAHTLRSGLTYNATTFTNCKDTIKGLSADGGSHKLSLLTNVANNCTFDSTGIRAPKGNKITSFRIDTTVLKCDEDKYQLIASWVVSAPAAEYDTLIIVDGSNTVLLIDTLKSTTLTRTVTLPQVHTVGDVTTPTPIYAYLKERGRSACDKSDTYVSPVKPTMSWSTHVIADSAECDKSTYSLIVPVTYTNQHGKMHVWLDADSYAAASYKVEVTSSTGFDGSDGYMEGAAERTTRAKLTDLPGDGAEHKVSIAFDDERGCTKKDAITYEAPFRPVINKVEATRTTPADGVLTYDVTVTVTTSNGQGKAVTIKCADLNLEHTGNVDGDGKLVKEFTGLTTDNGVSHTFKAYFDDRKNCVEEGAFTSPDQRKIHSFDVIERLLPQCDGTANVVFVVNSTAMGGDLVIKEGDTEVYRHATPIPSEFKDTIKHASLKADGSSHTLTASFTSPVQSKTATYTALANPTLSIEKGVPSYPNCKGTITLPLTVTYTNQSPTAYLTLIDEKGNNAVDPILVEDLDPSPCTINWNYTADGKEHSVYAYISDRSDCQTDPVSITAPSAPYWEYTRHRSLINCDGSYTDTLRFSWKDASSAFTIDTLDSNGNAITAQRYSNTASTDDVVRLYHGNVADASANIYKVYFAGHAGDCDSIIKNFESGHAPIKPEIVINKADTLHGACDATTYAIVVDWQYKAFAASTMTFSVTGATQTATRELTYNPEFVACKDTVKGLPTDGGLQTLTMKTDVAANCSYEKADIRAPKGNMLAEFSVKTTQLTCTNGNYQLVATWKVEAPAAAYDVLVIVDENDNLLLEETLTSTTLSHTATLPQSYAEGDAATPKTIYAYLKERGKGCAKSDTYSDPVQPTMAIGEVNKTLATNCSDSTYTIVVPVTYKNQRGDMWAWIDSDTQKHQITATEKSGTGEDYAAEAAEHTTYIEFAGLVADGKQHTIHIACDETQGACAKTKTYDAPFTPVIDSVVVSCNEPAFGATTYDATVKVYYKNASKNGTASSLTIRSTDLGAGQSQRSRTVTVSGDGVYTWEVTGLTAEKGATRHFEAFFVDRDTCVFNEEVQTPDTRKLIFSVIPSVVNCDGKDTILFTVNASDLSGNLVVMEGATELYNQPAPTAYPFHGKIETPVPAGSVHNLYAYFTSDTEFHSSTVTFTAPAAPTISMGREPGHSISCGGEVTMTLVVEYANQTGSLIVLDNENALIKEIAHDTLPASPIRIPWTYAADGKSRTATAYFSNRPSCTDTEDADEVTEAYRTFTHHLSEPDCDGYYNDTIRFVWSHAKGVFVIDSLGTNLCTNTDADGTCDRIIRSCVTDADRELYKISFSAQSDCEPTSVHNSILSASVLTSFKVDTVYAASCGATTYNVDLSWTYAKAVDDLVIIDENDAVIWTAEVTNLLVSYSLTDLPIDASLSGKAHTLYAYFRDKGTSCKKVVTYNEPIVPAMDTVKTEFAPTECNNTTTTLTVDVEYIKQSGTLQVWYDTGTPLTVTYDSIGKNNLDTVHITIPDFPADGKDSHVLHVSFTGDLDCHDRTYDLPRAPFSPKVSGSKVVRFENETCNSDTYSAVVTFDVTNGQGKKVVATCKGLSAELSAASEGENTIRIDGITRANPREAYEVISIAFPDATDCAEQDTVHFIEPHKPQLLAIRLDDQQAEVDCEAKQYTLRGAVQYINIGDATPQLWIGDDEASAILLTGTPEMKDDTATLTFNAITIPTDGKPFTLHLKADGKTAGCSIQEDFTAIWRQVISGVRISGVPNAVSCDEPYSATVEVDYLHGLNQRIYVTYRDSDNTARLDSSAVLDIENSTAQITLPKLYDTGALDKNVTVYFANNMDCAIDTAKFHLPALNSITDVTATGSASTCGELNYSVSGKVTFNSGEGDLVVYYDDMHRDTIKSPVSPATYYIESMSEAGTGLQVYAYFTGADKCKQESNVFDSPVVPTLSADITGVDTVFTCGDKTYTVHYSISSTNQSGACLVLDSVTSGTVRTIATDETVQSFTIARPATNEQHFVVVRYPATGCEVVIPTPLIVSPLVPAMGEAVLAQSQPECGETDYTLSLSFSHTNMNLLPAADRTLVITDNGTELYNDTIPATVAMTFELPALGDAHTVQITCGLCSATYNYVAPKPYECARYDTLICITEHYAAHGFDITPDRTMTDSLFTRWNGHGTDSLFLTVKEQPAIKLADVSRICDSERELAFPYSVLSGVIDSVQLTLTNAGGTDVIADEPIRVTDDTLYYNLSSSLPAGDYLTSVEVFTRGIVCSSSASTPLTIAKDSVIYSKWTDVLLVDNSAGLYTGYQWYENGNPISGQTGQTLYMPEGMDGTYYCRLTTADGDIFTCEYDFDAVPRSADHQQTTNHITVAPSRIQMGGAVTVQQSEQETLRLILLSATGQRLAEYTQSESTQQISMPTVQGVYMLRIASDTIVQTEKIVVY